MSSDEKCDYCNHQFSDTTEFCFAIEQKDSKNDYEVRYFCMSCFDSMFSVRRFIEKYLAKDTSVVTKQTICFECESAIRQNYTHRTLTCVNDKIILEVQYCLSCFEKEIGSI